MPPARAANRGLEVWGGNPRYALYPTQDGKTVAVSLGWRPLLKKFCDVIGQPDLASGPEDPSARLSSHGALNAQFATRSPPITARTRRIPMLAESASLSYRC